MTSSENLEAKCRRLVNSQHAETSDPASLIEHEISLTLEQIDAVRSQEHQLEDRLTKREIDLKTRILNLKTPPLEYNWDRWARRKQMTHQLETSLVRLEQQFQGLAVEREKRLHTLQDRLLELWNRREQVAVD